MAPMQNIEGSKSSKMIVKRLWNKLMTPKEKVKKDKPDDWVLDSVPDYASENKTDQQTEQPENRPLHNEENGKKVHNSSETEEQFTNDEKILHEEEGRGKRPKRTSEKKHENLDDSPKQIIYNMNVTNGKVQIGDTTVQTFNIQQNFNAKPTKKEGKSAEKKKGQKTPQIDAILQSTVKVDSAHLTHMSNHFGNKWRDIGLALGFSNGDLDRIENNLENDVKTISFEMLNTWVMKNGDNATVGRLCRKLWNTRIVNAREAVKLFADNFSNFN